MYIYIYIYTYTYIYTMHRLSTASATAWERGTVESRIRRVNPSRTQLYFTY